MSDEILKFQFELVGPRARKTCSLGASKAMKQYKFVEGIHTVIGTTPGISALKRILAKCYNAHLPGSPEHVAAVKLWAANPASPKYKGSQDGNSSVPATSAPRQANAVSSNVQPPRAGAPTPKTNDVTADNAPDVSNKPTATPAKS